MKSHNMGLITGKSDFVVSVCRGSIKRRDRGEDFSHLLRQIFPASFDKFV